MAEVSEKFEVGDVVVCVDDSPWAGMCSADVLKKGKAYEVLRAGLARDIFVPESHRAWKGDRFRRATLAEIRKYRKEQGYEKHHFAVGDLVVCLATEYSYGLSIGQIYKVSAVKIDGERECFVDLDGGNVPGRYFAAYFRKATPAEAEAYRKDKEKATATFVAGEEIKSGQLVTVSIGDKPPFKAVVLEAPTADDPYVKLSRAAGIDWASAEAGPSFNVTFTWEGPEKKPLTGNDAPEAINKAIAVPNPQMLTSADGREFEIIDWRPTVRTGEVVTVEANMMVKQARDKPFEALKAVLAACQEAPKPAASAWEPKPGDLVVCIDVSVSTLRLGGVYEVGTGKNGDLLPLKGSSISMPLERNTVFYRLSSFRPATPDEIYDYHKDKGFPDHQFNVGDIVVAVDVRVADWTQIAPDFAVGSVHEVLCRSGIGIRVSGCDRQGFWNITRFRKATDGERVRFFNEKLDKEGPGDGYRLLGKEERLDESDEVFDAEKGTWVPTIRAGETAGTGPNRYRRRNKFAEGELVQIVKPATEQERAKWPGWYPSMDKLDAKVIPMPKLADTKLSRLHPNTPIIDAECGDSPSIWEIATDWLAPATKAQKEAYGAKKAKIQELEDKMKDIQSELSSLKGT